MALPQMGGGTDDPSDQSNAQPAPTPPPSPNPIAPSPSVSPVVIASPSHSSDPVPVDPPSDFIAAVDNALMSRLGPTKYGLIPAADKKALFAKIWQDPNIQSYYFTNRGLLSTDVTVAGQFGGLISNVLMGQGNDPTVAVDYFNMLQAAGVSLTVSEQAALAGATQAVNAPVPRPFGENTVSGYDYGTPMPAGGWSSKYPGQSFGWDKHYGVDYGTRAGERIVSPFAGTIVASTNVSGYGNIVYVQLDNGWIMGFGHVGQIEAQSGTRVNPGDLIAIAGANVGSSQGAVTIVTYQAPGGKWVNGVYQGEYSNPHNILDPIFAGTTFSSLGAPGAAGTGMPTVNKVLDAEYPSIKSDWVTYFGSPPSPEDVYNVLQHGSSPAQWSDYIRALPSHMDGLNQGQYYDMRQVADGASTKVLGHPSTDSIVKELYDKQITTPTAALNWYNEHGVTGIPTEDYNKIYGAVKKTMNAVFVEDGADPRDILNIYNKGNQSAL